jgi:hypothetical protein
MTRTVVAVFGLFWIRFDLERLFLLRIFDGEVAVKNDIC